MTNPILGASAHPRARITGVVYLLYFLTAVSGEVFVGHGHPVAYDAVYLIAHAFYVTLAVLFYYMFRPVNRRLSLFAAVVCIAGCADDIFNLYSPTPNKAESLVFFGPYCLLIGYLILRSTFLPRILGVLMALAGVGWLVFLTPLGHPLARYLMVLGFVAEAALMLWLIIRGVDVEHWKEQSSAAENKEGADS
jgi:Domain of unknown function (DUF4386)